MEISTNSQIDTHSLTETACSYDSPTMLEQSNLLYDQHSSEEELEVINGPSSLAAAEAAKVLSVRGTASSLASERESSSLEADDLYGGDSSSPKRSTSTLLEIRKRSLAHSSDDELRHLMEPIQTPVNFRSSPPIEALKPNRSHILHHRATTPSTLLETSRRIENIKISCDNNCDQKIDGSANNCSFCYPPSNSSSSNICDKSRSDNHTSTIATTTTSNATNPTCSSSSVAAPCSTLKSGIKSSNSSHYIHQPQPKYQFSNSSCCSRSSPALASSAPVPGLEMDVRSVSPPAKLFHCAISPRRRPMRTHAPQRLQRPHRPCLDFDKMQQLKDRPVTSWRHNSEHSSELSVFCW